jgi:hypothetical protein
MAANHGGGYQYRLCPKPANNMDLTEECFQQTPLRFVGSTQWLQNGTDESTRKEIPAMRTDTGTFPPGSQWTRVPIPACGTTGGGSQYPGSGTDQCDHMGIGTQFAPPIDGAYGFNGMNWNIIDNVQVPNLPTGDYVIGFRYDCEQTTQVWQVCGDVRIVTTPTPPPSDNCDNPLCSSCCVGDCSGCKNCLTDKLSDGCVPCWAAGTQCLSDDDSACEACWSSKPLPASFRTGTI